MSDGVIVTFEISVIPEAAEGFSRMGSEIIKGTRTFAGFRELQIVRHKDDPCRFLFIEHWDSEQAYHDYIAWRAERGELEALKQMATNIETSIWPHLIIKT